MPSCSLLLLSGGFPQTSPWLTTALLQQTSWGGNPKWGNICLGSKPKISFGTVWGMGHLKRCPHIPLRPSPTLIPAAESVWQKMADNSGEKPISAWAEDFVSKVCSVLHEGWLDKTVFIICGPGLWLENSGHPQKPRGWATLVVSLLSFDPPPVPNVHFLHRPSLRQRVRYALVVISNTAHFGGGFETRLANFPFFWSLHKGRAWTGHRGGEKVTRGPARGEVVLHNFKKIPHFMV